MELETKKKNQTSLCSDLPCWESIYVDEFAQHRQQPGRWQRDKKRPLFVHLMFHYPMTENNQQKKRSVFFQDNRSSKIKLVSIHANLFRIKKLRHYPIVSYPHALTLAVPPVKL